MACQFCSDDKSLHPHNKRVLKRARRGDVLEFKRFPYSHYGIYTGDGCKVIHYAPLENNTNKDNTPISSIFTACGWRIDKANVQLDCIFKVAGGSRVYINNKYDEFISPKTDDEIFEVAKGDLGEHKGGYNLATHNCEHEAIDWRYGVHIPFCNQIEKFFCFVISIFVSTTDFQLKKEALDALNQIHHLKQINVLLKKMGSSSYFKPLVLVLGLILKLLTKLGKFLAEKCGLGLNAKINFFATVIEAFDLDIYAKLPIPEPENNTGFCFLRLVLSVIICRFSAFKTIFTHFFSIKASWNTINDLDTTSSTSMQIFLTILLQILKIAISWNFPAFTIIMRLFGDDGADYLLKTLIALKDSFLRQNYTALLKSGMERMKDAFSSGMQWIKGTMSSIKSSVSSYVPWLLQ